MMKSRFILILLFYALSITFISSSCNEDINNNEESAEDIHIQKLAESIGIIKANIANNQKSDAIVAAMFDIRIEGEQYLIENISYLNENEYGFAQGFGIELARSSSSGTIKVSCDATGDIDECPNDGSIGSDMRQARCVGEAVKNVWMAVGVPKYALPKHFW